MHNIHTHVSFQPVVLVVTTHYPRETNYDMIYAESTVVSEYYCALYLHH